MTRTSEHAWLVATARATVVGLAMTTLGCDESQSQSKSQSRPAFDLDAWSVVQWNLPKRLKEISGLALSADDRLFAHDDELGVIHQIDWHGGSLVKSFALGEPAIHGDFEGIATVGAEFYLIASDGVLYRAAEGADGAHVTYEQIDTGLGAQCEIEGLAYDPRRALLLIACKTPRVAALKGQVAVFAWSPQQRSLDAGASFTIPEKALAGTIGVKHFNPSSIDVSRDGTRVWLLAARQRALAELGVDGQVVAVTRLPARHQQPEGLAIGPDGELIIADEGGDGRATLAIYRPR